MATFSAIKARLARLEAERAEDDHPTIRVHYLDRGIDPGADEEDAVDAFPSEEAQIVAALQRGPVAVTEAGGCRVEWYD